MEPKKILRDNTCNERIKFVRDGKLDKKHKKMTQDKLAIKFRVDNCNIRRDTITSIESCRRDVFDVEMLWFALTLNVSPYYLLNVDGPSENEENIFHYELSKELTQTEDMRNFQNRKNICGVWIQQIRYGWKKKKRPDITQIELARRMSEEGFKMTYHTIIRIEKGSRRVSVTELKVFAKVLDVPVYYLIEGKDNKMPDIQTLTSYVAEDD